MAHQLTVLQGGGTAPGTVDYTPQIPVYEIGDGHNVPLIDGGMRFDNGGACQYQFVVIDDVGEIPKADGTKRLSSHNVVLWTEDAPGYAAWLSRGRISSKNIDGGDHPWGDSRTFQVTVDDANIDLRGLALVEPWVRPAESDVARVEACVTAFLSGDPRATTDITAGTAHLVPNTNTVTMPAKTYAAGTDVLDILGDCASTAGKVFGVVIHHVSSASHLCLLYIDEADHDTYASTLSITDDEPDLDTEFPPIWDQGAAAVEQGGDVPVSLVVSNYGLGTASYTTVSAGTAIVNAYDYWAVSFNDPISTTTAQATQRATSQLGAGAREHVTHQVTIKIPADKVDLLCAGMSIDMRSARSMGGQYLHTVQTRRIAQLKWEPIAPEVGEVVGQYHAHMQLDRPAPVPATKLPLTPAPAACDGSPSVVRSWPVDFAAPSIDDVNVEGAGNTALVVIVAHSASATDPAITYDPLPLDVTSPTYAFTKYGELVNPSDVRNSQITVLYLLNPVAAAAGKLTISGGGDHFGWGAILLSDIDPDALIRTTDSRLGTVNGEASSSNTISALANELVLSAFTWNTDQVAANAPVPGGSQTQIFAYDPNPLPGQGQFQLGVSVQTAAAAGTMTNSWTQGDTLGAALTQWDLALTACPGAISIGGPGEGTTGESGSYVPGGTVIEHPDLSGKGGTMHDASQIEYDNSSSGMTADDVQAAIDELDAALSGHTGDTTDAHDASAISIADSGAYFTGTDVEAALQELGAGGGGGGGGSLTVEEVDGSPTDSAVTKLILPNGSLAISSHEATITFPGGSGGGGKGKWQNPPASGLIDDFSDGSISGSWTLVRDEARMTWAEKYGTMTAVRDTAVAGSGTRDLEAYLQSVSLSAGDYIEGAFHYKTLGTFFGLGLIMSDGTTLGAGKQMVHWLYQNGVNSTSWLARLYSWTNFTTEGAASFETAIDSMPRIEPFYVRLKYEAANTWGLYLSYDGVGWVTLKNNLSFTMTPTHAGIVIVHHSNPNVAGQSATWYYIGKNTPA